MKLIPLTKGKFAKVDDEDFDRINQFKWCITFNNGKAYACRRSLGRKIYLHWFLIREKGVDHIDGDGLNNQKRNLRKCTQSQNLQNKIGNGKSKLKGVWFWKSRGKYQANIQLNGKKRTIGYFDTAEDAANAYDSAAIALFGKFALTNKMIGFRHEI